MIAAVDVEVAVDLDRLDEQRQRDRDPHEPPIVSSGVALAAEVLDPAAVHVVDDRVRAGSPISPAVSAPEAPVEQLLDRLALGQPGEAAQRREREARDLAHWMSR